MNRQIVRAVLVAGGVLGFALPSAAQFYPGYGWGSYGGYDGSAALLGADSRQVQAMQLKAQNMQAGQQAAQNQNYVVQSGIRNTLSSQAQSRNAAILNQQQATQDWWFQQQQAKAARGAATGYDTAPRPAAAWSSFGPSNKPPPPSMDIIQWPTMLQENCFASERAEIEAPYRRAPLTPGGKTPPLDAADYRAMAAAVEDMKATLLWRQSEGVNPADFDAAKAFVTQLAGEIATRMK